MTKEITTGPPDTVRGEWGLVCPKCGHDDHFKVAIRAWGWLTGHGIEDLGDTAWGSNSDLMCTACEWEGKVTDARMETTHANIGKQKPMPDTIFSAENSKTAIEKLIDKPDLAPIAVLTKDAPTQVIPGAFGHDAKNPVEDWLTACRLGSRLGYAEWVASKREQDEDEADPFSPDHKFFWWNAGEVGPAVVDGERLSEILREVNHDETTTEMVGAIDIQGFWIGYIDGGATVVMAAWALQKHLLVMGEWMEALGLIEFSPA